MTPSDATSSGAGFRFGDFVVRPATREILRRGETVEVEAKVFDLVALLLAHRERALGKQDIVDALWGSRPVTDAALSQLVHKARRALDDDGRSVIRTVYGRGLQWIAPTEPFHDDADAQARAAAASGDAIAAVADPASSSPSNPPRRARATWAAGFAAALVFIVGALLWFGTARTALRPPQVAVMPIDNASGDAALDWTRLGLAALMTTELQRLGVSGVDSRQVEQLALQAPAAHRDAKANVRAGSGAVRIVGGTLRRVGELSRLDLEVDGDGVRTTLSASGPAPAQLAVDLAAQLADRLRERPATSAATTRERAPWLAETYARGMDLAARNEWAQAKPYFVLCLQEDADFAEARLNLARMQSRSGEEADAQQNFETLVAQSDANAPDALRARMELATLVAQRGDRAAAARQLQALREPAERSGLATLPAWIDMNLAQIEAELGHAEAADAAFARAEAIIREHGLRDYEPRLYNIASIIAEARHDLPAASRANRRALEAATALGNRTAALGAALNAAALDVEDGHPLSALPLLVQSWRDARELQARDERIFAGQTLAEAALRLGAATDAAPFLAALRGLAERRGVPRWLATQQAIDGVALRQGGQPRQAIARFDAIRQTLQGADLAAFLPPVIDEHALAAWELRDAAALDALATEARGIAPGAAAPAQVEMSALLVEALAAAARSDAKQAQALLDDARHRAALARDAATRDRLFAVGARIALAQDADSARRWFDRFDAAASENADALSLYRAFAQRSGNAEAQAHAEARLAALRQAASDALADVAMAEPESLP